MKKYNIGDCRIISFKEMLKHDRWPIPIDIIRGMGGTENDNIAFEKTGENRYFVYILNPELVEKLDITDKQGDELLKELIKSMPKNIPIEGVDHILQVKSHYRVSKNKLERIFSDIGAGEDDFFVLYHVNDDNNGAGWEICVLKKDKIPKSEYVDDKN